MRAISRWLVGGSLVGAAALMGCASHADAESAAVAQSALSQDPPEVAHAQIIRDALSKVSLRPDQQAQVDQLAKDAEARHDAIKQAGSAVKASLADQVQAGKIDRVALQPQTAALVAAVEQSRPADQAAFVRLHDILDKTQRGQFIDALEARFETAGHHGGGPGHMGGPGQGMHQWGADLNLTADQRQQLGAALKAKFQGEREGMKQQWHAMRDQGHQLLESFRQDQFTLDANSPVLMSRDRIVNGLDRKIDLAEVAVPILTPEQRAIAAQKIRTHQGPGL